MSSENVPSRSRRRSSTSTVGEPVHKPQRKNRKGGGNGGGDNRTSILDNPKLFTLPHIHAMGVASMDACMKAGVMPQDLVKRDYDSFYNKRVSGVVQKLRFTEYENHRLATINQVREVYEEMQAKRRHASSGGDGAINFRSDQNKSQVARSLLIEQQRTEATMARQAKELETMLTYEIRRAEINAKMDDKLAARAAKERELYRNARKARKSQQEKQREWKLSMRRKQREAEALQKEKASRQRDAELTRKALKKKADRKARRLQMSKQAERDAAKLAREEYQEQLVDMELQGLEIRDREMKRREQDRRRKLNKQRAARQELENERRAKQKARVARAQANNDRMTEEKRRSMQQRQADNDARLLEYKQKREMDHVNKMKEVERKEAARRRKFREAKESQAQKVARILQAAADADTRREQVEQEKFEEYMYKQEVANIKRQHKQDNVTRLRRRREYHRIEMIEKIHLDTIRTRELKKQKDNLIRTRERNRNRNAKQKLQVMRTFNQLQHSGNWKQMSSLLPKTSSIKEDLKLLENKGGQSTTQQQQQQQQQQLQTDIPPLKATSAGEKSRMSKSQSVRKFSTAQSTKQKQQQHMGKRAQSSANFFMTQPV